MWTNGKQRARERQILELDKGWEGETEEYKVQSTRNEHEGEKFYFIPDMEASSITYEGEYSRGRHNFNQN